MKRLTEPRLPFPFNILMFVVPLLSLTAILAATCFVVWLAYTVISGDLDASDIGRFFGEVVSGFNEAAK